MTPTRSFVSGLALAAVLALASGPAPAADSAVGTYPDENTAAVTEPAPTESVPPAPQGMPGGMPGGYGNGMMMQQPGMMQGYGDPGMMGDPSMMQGYGDPSMMQGYGGPGMMQQGYGDPSMMQGYGGYPGMGQDMPPVPGGPGDMGYGQGYGQMPPGQMGPGTMSPGMMQQMQQMAPSMMQGRPGMGQQGQGPGRMQGNQPPGGAPDMIYGGPETGGNKDLSVDDVKAIVAGQLAWMGNDNLTVGKVTKVDDYRILAEIVTKDGSLVQKLEVDRATGSMRPVR